MCGETCAESEVHQDECSVLERVQFEAEVGDLQAGTDDHYAMVLPLRCIALRERDPAAWALLQGLESHCSQRREVDPASWEFHTEHSVQFVREMCELEAEWTEEELHRLLGAVSVNSLALATSPGYGKQLGLYPVFSYINHSCLSNAKPVKLSGGGVEVRARTAIQAGQEVTVQYLQEALPTAQRRQLINRKWHFW